ncbi:MAG: hypothetical protein GY774_20635 [Planctomycetes bacterium]|nr:hypothetical protein [Planctomycetota bacterium]
MIHTKEEILEYSDVYHNVPSCAWKDEWLDETIEALCIMSQLGINITVEHKMSSNVIDLLNMIDWADAKFKGTLYDSTMVILNLFEFGEGSDEFIDTCDYIRDLQQMKLEQMK